MTKRDAGNQADPKGAAPIENIVSLMQAARASVSPQSRKIIDFVLTNREAVLGMSITELAERAGVVESGVSKFCKAIGGGGFQHFKISLAQDVVQPVQFIHEDLNRDDDVDAVTEKVFHAGINALKDTLTILKRTELTRARDLILAAERVAVFGVGSAAPIADDIQYRMMRMGLDADLYIDPHKQAIKASLLGPGMVALTISHSGATHETVAATRLAKEAGASTIVITNFGKSPIYRHADVVLGTTARETQFRTEAMTSRIAQLCVADTLIALLSLGDFERSVATVKKTYDVLSSRRF